MKKVFFLLIMFAFFIEASSCNNSQGEKHNEMKVSSTAETNKGFSFWYWKWCIKKISLAEMWGNGKRKSVYNKKYDLGELGTGEEL